MSLSGGAPTFTSASSNSNLVSSQTCTYGTAITANFYVGVAGQSGPQGSITTGSALSGALQVWNTGGGTVSTTNGLQVTIYRSVDGSTYGTNPYIGPYTITTVVSTKETLDIDLPPGQYQINLQNLDSSHTTTVQAMLGTTA